MLRRKDKRDKDFKISRFGCSIFLFLNVQNGLAIILTDIHTAFDVNLTVVGYKGKSGFISFWQHLKRQRNIKTASKMEEIAVNHFMSII